MIPDDIWHAVATAHNAAIKRGILSMWTIYDNRTDHQNDYTARRFEVGKNIIGDQIGEPSLTADVIHGELQILREAFKHCGLVCFNRAPADDGKIVETWV